MAFSYTFHISEKSHAVTTIGKVSQVGRHNLRAYKSETYDRSQIEILRDTDKSILDEVKKIYHEEFDECLERYNQGKRSDRKIGDYLTHVSDSRADVAAEILIQIGDKDFWQNKTADEKRQMSYIFKDQLRAFEKLCPEFKIASVIAHYDESSPHIHVVGVPVANDYQKGMEKQVAKTKVFSADRLSYLQDKMRENAERGMNLEQNRNLFAGMELKGKEKGRNKDIPKKSLGEFYALQDQVKQTSNQLNKLASVSHALSDPDRTEPIHIDLQNGQSVSYMPVPELQKQSKDLEIEIENIGASKNDLKAQIDELDLLRNNLIQEVEKVQNELLEVQKLGKYLDEYDKRSKINIYESELPDGFLKKKTVVVVESDLDAEQVQDIFRSNSIRKGVIEEAKDNIRQGQEEADQMLKDAAETIRQAQEIQNQRDQILILAEQERKSIIAKAEAKAKEIIAKLKETINQLKEQIAELLGRKNKLQKEADQIISVAKEEADNIIKNASKIEDRFSSASRESEMIKKVKRYEKVINSSPELKNLFEKAESSMQQQENSRYK